MCNDTAFQPRGREMDWKIFSCHPQFLKPLWIIVGLVTLYVDISGGRRMAAVAPLLLHGPTHSHSPTHPLTPHSQVPRSID